MLHKMKLFEDPFENIKNGTKTVEFRLFDEKRQKIKVGDQIEFSKLPDLKEKIVVNVDGLYREDTFEKLLRKFYNDEEIKSIIKVIHEIYSPEQEKTYGALGIKISLKYDNKKIKIRYHHLMCIPRYKGNGYSEKFCENLERVKHNLKNNNYVLVDDCDDICSCCPNNIDGKCTDENKVKKYDKLVKEKLIKGEKLEPKNICDDCCWFYICKDIDI